MSFERYILENTNDKFDSILELIKLEGLDSRSRVREVVYKRAYLYNEIRSMMEFKSYESIGLLFNRDHATVLHGIRTHNDLIKTKDVVYNQVVIQMDSFLGKKPIDKNKVLRKRILNCRTVYDLNIVKHLINSDQL